MARNKEKRLINAEESMVAKTTSCYAKRGTQSAIGQGNAPEEDSLIVRFNGLLQSRFPTRDEQYVEGQC